MAIDFVIAASFIATGARAQEDPTGLEDALPTEQLAQVKIVGFGDSLMAGYLLPSNAAFPQQLEKRWTPKVMKSASRMPACLATPPPAGLRALTGRSQMAPIWSSRNWVPMMRCAVFPRHYREKSR